MNAAEDFVGRFTEYWTAPNAQKMSLLLTEDVVLIQPLAAPMSGLDQAQAQFDRLFAWLPDLHAQIDGWSSRGNSLYIELRLAATLRGRPLQWRAVDRLELRGDKACRRVSYFDALPLVLRLLTTPGAWPGWWRSGLRLGV
jgi:hypothetical protein